jgi:hypothetical protein
MINKTRQKAKQKSRANINTAMLKSTRLTANFAISKFYCLQPVASCILRS